MSTATGTGTLAPLRTPSRAFVYVRLSAHAGLGPSQQVARAEEYLRQSDSIIERIYVDRREPGDSARPQLEVALRDIANLTQPPSMLVIDSVDRISRDTAEVLRIFDLLRSRGVELHAVSYGRLELASISPQHFFERRR